MSVGPPGVPDSADTLGVKIKGKTAPLAADESFDVWGPRVDVPPVTVKRLADLPQPPARRRRPWGLGDVAWCFAGLLLSQLVVLIGFVVVAVMRVGPDAAHDPAGVMEQVMKVSTEATKVGLFLVFALVIQWFAFVGPTVYAARRKGRGRLRNTFGFFVRPKRDIALGLGLAAFMQVLLWGVQRLITALGINTAGSDNTSMVTDNHGIFLILMIAGAAVGAPIVEELFFRGLVLGALAKRIAKFDLFAPVGSPQEPASAKRRKLGVLLSAFISALLFGGLHMTTDGNGEFHLVGATILMLQTGSLGFVFALVAAKTRRLGVTMCAHIAFNSSSIALVLLTR